MDDIKNVCACGNEFTHKKNLYAHMRKVHQIEPLQPKRKPMFECDSCGKTFSVQSTIIRHIRQTHYTGNKYHSISSTRKVKLKCPHDPCTKHCMSYVILRQHLAERHDVHVEYEELSFASLEDFEEWRNEIQQKTLSLYTRNTATKTLKSGESKIIFNCHRSNVFKSKGKNIRAMKMMGSNKMGKTCPSRIEVTSTKHNGESVVSVKYWKTHCGHDRQIKRTPLNKEIRLLIAEKLIEGFTFDEILEGIHNTDVNDMIPPRLQCLNRKDIHNIVRDFKLKHG